MTAATGDSLSFGYDALKRLNRVTVKNGSSVILNTAYAYRDVSWNRGSAQVEFRNVRLGSDSVLVRRESAVHQWTDFLHDGAMTILASVRSAK